MLAIRKLLFSQESVTQGGHSDGAIHLTISFAMVVAVIVAFILGLLVGLSFSYLSIAYKRAMVKHIMNDAKVATPMSEFKTPVNRKYRRDVKRGYKL